MKLEFIIIKKNWIHILCLDETLPYEFNNFVKIVPLDYGNFVFKHQM